jgi:mono/diheme cytochrome c family protein
MKTLIIFSFALAMTFIIACGGAEKNETSNNSDSKPESMVNSDPSSYDPKRGEGKFTAENIQIGETIDEAKASSGEKIQGVKCASCHKLSDEKLVGPGWKGVTTRRQPVWLMNFITNPDPMIDKDPEVQAQLELCLVRMPNQGLTDEEARDILEFMRKNDL